MSTTKLGICLGLSSDLGSVQALRHLCARGRERAEQTDTRPSTILFIHLRFEMFN